MADLWNVAWAYACAHPLQSVLIYVCGALTWNFLYFGFWKDAIHSFLAVLPSWGKPQEKTEFQKRLHAQQMFWNWPSVIAVVVAFCLIALLVRMIIFAWHFPYRFQKWCQTTEESPPSEATIPMNRKAI